LRDSSTAEGNPKPAGKAEVKKRPEKVGSSNGAGQTRCEQSKRNELLRTASIKKGASFDGLQGRDQNRNRPSPQQRVAVKANGAPDKQEFLHKGAG